MATADVSEPVIAEGGDSASDSKWLEYPGPKHKVKYPLRILYCESMFFCHLILCSSGDYFFRHYFQSVC